MSADCDATVFLDNLPLMTSKWEQQSEVVYQLFKARISMVDVDTILWPADEHGNNLKNWFAKRSAPCNNYYDNIFNFLDRVFQNINTDELTWYNGTHHKGKAESLFALTLMNMRDYMSQSDIQDVVLEEVKRTETRMLPFLCHLRTVLEMNYNKICEKTYEELFRHLLHIIGLASYSGEVFSPLSFQYEKKIGDVTKTWRISTEPDLLVYSTAGNARGFAIGVVEVKKDEEIIKILERKTNSTASTSSSAPLEKEDASAREGFNQSCVAEQTADAISDVEQEEMVVEDGVSVSGFEKNGMVEDIVKGGEKSCGSKLTFSLMETDYQNGNPRALTEEEEDIMATFLPQLMGGVAAALNCEQLDFQSVPLRDVRQGHHVLKSTIGFGIVGFKVYVINFLCVARKNYLKGKWHFHSIPFISGLGIDVLVSQSLNILNRQDRNKLFRLLYALKTLYYFI